MIGLNELPPDKDLESVLFLEIPGKVEFVEEKYARRANILSARRAVKFYLRKPIKIALLGVNFSTRTRAESRS